MHAPGSQAARLLHAFPALCTAPRRSLGTIRPQIINSLSDSVLISEGKRVFVQHLAPPGSEPVGRLQAGPLRVGMRSLGRLCCCHDKKRACTGSMNQLEKAHLPVKWLRGTATLTRCRGAVLDPHPSPNRTLSPLLHPETGRGCARSEKNLSAAAAESRCQSHALVPPPEAKSASQA